MKRIICAALLLLCFTAVPANAQNIRVETTGGAVDLNYPSASTRITFSSGKMLFHSEGKVVHTFDIKTIDRIAFVGYNNIEASAAKQAVIYVQDTDELVVNVTPGTAIAIYRPDGICVWSQLKTIAASAIDLTHLSSGTYVVTAGSETLKFVKP